VRSHHERWDGGGYPEGRQGDAIPLGSRVIAACDSFVAIATDRPYRRGVGVEAALEVVRQDDGQQFDPEVVDALVSVITGEHVARRPRAVAVETLRSAEASMPAPRLPADSGQRAESGPAGNGGSRRHGGHDLRIAISDLDVLPALAPASERLLTLLEGENATESELTNAIETDGGLTVAILKEAQALSGRRPITNVADAVAALDRSQIRSAVAGLPRAAFPWGASRRQSLLHRIRVHALIVARSAQRIAREVGFQDVDELVVVALLHDVGKLVLARAFPDYDALVEPRTTTPEERLRQEQRSFRLDHASIGGLLIGRWGLPARIGNAVSAHHSCEQPGELAAFVRLADMATHHALGEVIDRSTLMHLAEVCGLSVAALRDVLFDLPRADGSRRRRADPSPLSPRESDAIRLLAQGKVYTAIAADLDLAPSTVRSHLHKAYQKLGVVDRAQAVLRATEMGWI
jgi:putative nucleotidyltransferase with HDIG domain